MAGDGPAPRVVVFRREDPDRGDPRGVEADASGSRPPRAEQGGRRRPAERSNRSLASGKACLERKDNVREAAYERARERIFAEGSSRDESPSSRRSGRSGSHSGASSRSASPSDTTGRSRPPVAIVRDRAADLKDPDFTRGVTRFAPGVDDTQTYADVRCADGVRGVRRGDGRARRDDPRRSRAVPPSGRSTEPGVERREEARARDDDARDDDGPRARSASVERARARVDASWLGDARAATLAADGRSRSGLDAFAALGFASAGGAVGGGRRRPRAESAGLSSVATVSDARRDADAAFDEAAAARVELRALRVAADDVGERGERRARAAAAARQPPAVGPARLVPRSLK